MKKALLIGNCQNHSLIGFLNKNEEFRRTYETKFYANWEMIERKDSIPTMELMNADLFIYHPLAPVHGCYSTDPNVDGSIGSLVKEGCLKISHPYVYSSAMWPLIQHDHNGRDWFGNEVIDGLIANGMMFPIHRSAVEYYNLTYADRYIDDSDSFYEQRIIQYYNQSL